MGRKLNVFQLLCLSKIDREKLFGDVLDKRKPLKSIKTSVYEKCKIRNFPNRLLHGFCQKFEIFLTFRFMQNTPRKNTFWLSRSKTSLSRQCKRGFQKKAKLAFLQRGYSMILVKKLKFFHFLCVSKIDREKLFAKVLENKESFKEYKNKCLRKTQN